MAFFFLDLFLQCFFVFFEFDYLFDEEVIGCEGFESLFEVVLFLDHWAQLLLLLIRFPHRHIFHLLTRLPSLLQLMHILSHYLLFPFLYSLPQLQHPSPLILYHLHHLFLFLLRSLQSVFSFWYRRLHHFCCLLHQIGCFFLQLNSFFSILCTSW